MIAKANGPLSNPSHSHEVRRILLETMAGIAGYHLKLRLQERRQPDVLRLHVGRESVFLGEAKHTEGPSNLGSVDRLRVYLDWLLPLCSPGTGGILAIAHPRGLGQPWRQRVDWLLKGVQLGGLVKSRNVALTTTITFVVFKPDSYCGHDALVGTARTKGTHHTGV